MKRVGKQYGKSKQSEYFIIHLIRLNTPKLLLGCESEVSLEFIEYLRSYIKAFKLREVLLQKYIYIIVSSLIEGNSSYHALLFVLIGMHITSGKFVYDVGAFCNYGGIYHFNTQCDFSDSTNSVQLVNSIEELINICLIQGIQCTLEKILNLSRQNLISEASETAASTSS